MLEVCHFALTADQTGGFEQFGHHFSPVCRTVAGQLMLVIQTVVIVQMAGNDMGEQFFQSGRFLDQISPP